MKDFLGQLGLMAFAIFGAIFMFALALTACLLQPFTWGRREAPKTQHNVQRMQAKVTTEQRGD